MFASSTSRSQRRGGDRCPVADVSSARDRAIEIVAGESKSTDRGAAALHAWAAVEALIANPEVLRALAAEAGAPDTPPAAVQPAWTPIPPGRVQVWEQEGRDPLWQALVTRLHGADAVDNHGLSIADAERLVDAALDEIGQRAMRLVPAAAPTPTGDARLLDMDRDAAIEAAAEAMAEMNDPEDGGGEFAHAAVMAAIGYLSSQPYPVTLGPARRTEEAT